MTIEKITILILSLIVATVVVLSNSWKEQPTLGAASNGVAATAATTSAVLIAANTVHTIAATSSCAARIITTQNTGAVTLTIGDQFSPTLGTGIWQPASTTVAYDCGIYGGGAMKVRGVAAETITIIETR